ncbi:hypothetical protein KB553_09530 [Chryseobacterium rhizoplanae]|uniref:FISUMP domain-containing protein n=1 Tax=Chryseobacterium rhizoplanae TaxID=1609531 RepID=UPI001CE27C45|nr:FISUMP domain-containing protein [Chryseobacterium rhizoplanae]UCA61754.1 hypothetical protein KB553_09530 [Chryseobacterium rhizoplanae]
MKKLYLLPISLFGIISYAQVGVNNTTPKVTVDMTAKTTDGSKSEGLLIPRLTGNALHDAETAAVYGSDQHAALVFVTAAPDPNNRTGQVEGMDAPGFYYFDAGSNRWVKMTTSGTNTAQIGQLLCAQSINSGVLEATEPAAGVDTTIPYNQGNGGTYSGLSIPSTGVTGLFAQLPSGTLNNGSGTLTFSITGTPSTAGTAVFNLLLGGQDCGFSITVQPASSFPETLPVIINGQTRQMMTHNLGADQTQDPDVPSQAIMGSYYQWGKKNPVATAYTSAAAISGWSTASAADKSWNSGTEAVPVKTSNDPCPDGFRVPTRNEWVSFNTNSTTSIIGTWVTTANGGDNNFTAARKFVNNGSTLTFPTAGNRLNSTGALVSRAGYGYYWSSTENSTNAYSLYFNSTTINPAFYNNRTYGFSVRCISE